MLSFVLLFTFHFLARLIFVQPMKEKVIPFTFVTKKTREFEILKRCAQYYGSHLQVFSMEDSSHMGAIKKKASYLVEVSRNFQENQLYLFVDGFDVIIQRDLHHLAIEFREYARRRRISSEVLLIVMGEKNCWPWPKTTERGSPRGVSMQYMRNKSIRLLNNSLIESSDVCGTFEKEKGDWKYPNSGVFMGSGTAIKQLASCYAHHLNDGHFEDQAIMGLCIIQYPKQILIDVDSSLFLSHYAYNKKLFSRTACDPHYLNERGYPPSQLKTSRIPYVLHFNGPSGKYRMGTCMNMFSETCRL